MSRTTIPQRLAAVALTPRLGSCSRAAGLPPRLRKRCAGSLLPKCQRAAYSSQGGGGGGGGGGLAATDSPETTTGRRATVEVQGKTFATDETFNTPPNVLALASRRLHLQKDHPVSITRQIIEARFPPPTFRYYNTFHPVVSTHENFDSLGFPADHPSRHPSDTYYLNRGTLLRTHTSAHEAQLFASADHDGYLLSADVYRRDEVDRSHYPVFHQMEGARVWDRTRVPGGDIAAAVRADLARLPSHGVAVEDPNPPFHPERNPLQAEHHSAAEAEAIAAHLKRSLELMVVDVFSRAARAQGGGGSSAVARSADAAVGPDGEPLRVRWVEAYFPFTSPSWELEVLYAGDWLEVLGCGVTKQELHAGAGQPSRLGWAFGIGLERIAMLLFQIPDIRLFWSRDDRFLRQFRGVSDDLTRLRRFVPFSKYPPCYKDISFWLHPAAAGDGFHENDVMEIIRNVAGDVVEDVKLVDEFTHPTSGRKSLCYRINYRSLERTLTNAETNQLHDEVTRALQETLRVEIR